MIQKDFWNDKNKSEQVINQLNELKNKTGKVVGLRGKIESNIEILNGLKKSYDEELKDLLENELFEVKEKIDDLEVELLLSGPYDKLDVVMELHSGAGGTEACDWTEMLYRMYCRWCDKKRYKINSSL